MYSPSITSTWLKQNIDLLEGTEILLRLLLDKFILGQVKNPAHSHEPGSCLMTASHLSDKWKPAIRHTPIITPNHYSHNQNRSPHQRSDDGSGDGSGGRRSGGGNGRSDDLATTRASGHFAGPAPGGFAAFPAQRWLQRPFAHYCGDLSPCSAQK